MAVEVKVAAVLQRVVGGVKAVQGQGSTIVDLIKYLDERYPGFASQVLTDEGQLHRFVNIYINDEDIRYLGQLQTPVKDGDVVSILPALAGGAA
ncbi:MAG: MoaD family protein [Chloroflexi bacterium]|nr:MoaD family protein [Chloroflexota bacterium]